MNGLKEDAEQKAAEMCKKGCCKKIRINFLDLKPTGDLFGLKQPTGYKIQEIGGSYSSYDYACPQKQGK